MDFSKRSHRNKIQKKCQAKNVVQMGVAQQNRNLLLVEQLLHSKQAAASVERKTAFRDKVTTRVSCCTGVVASRS